MTSSQVLEESIPERQMFKTVFSYCIAIIGGPIISFFLTKYFFFDLILGDGVSSNVWAALTAVVVLHIALGLFIYRAYADASTAKPTSKQD